MLLYKSTAQPEKDIPLKYIWRVPDSTSALSYNFTFDSKLDSGVNVYVGGKYSSNVNHSDYTISGALTDLNNTSNFIVIKFNSQQINGSGNSVDTMTKCYSIELSYVTKNSNEDYTMKKSGITKLDADADGSVEAYMQGEDKDIEDCILNISDPTRFFNIKDIIKEEVEPLLFEPYFRIIY